MVRESTPAPIWNDWKEFVMLSPSIVLPEAPAFKVK
jgi:hypothetical protein